MRPNVYLSELLDAFLWVSAAGSSQNPAYVSRESGRIFWDTRSAGLEEELPEDVEDASLYARVPHKHDLDLGQSLALGYVDENAPDAYEQVRAFFSRRGGYSRFKDFLTRRGLLERWYSYEERATETALREWAESEDLELVEGQRPEE